MIKKQQYCALDLLCKITSWMELREEFTQRTPQGRLKVRAELVAKAFKAQCFFITSAVCICDAWVCSARDEYQRNVRALTWAHKSERWMARVWWAFSLYCIVKMGCITYTKWQLRKLGKGTWELVCSICSCACLNILLLLLRNFKTIKDVRCLIKRGREQKDNLARVSQSIKTRIQLSFNKVISGSVISSRLGRKPLSM